MKQLISEVTIEAPVDAVWDVLTDFDSYAEWNPFIVESAGDAEVGTSLHNKMKQTETRTATFRPTVTVVEAGQKLEWLGKLLVGGLFDGRHIFELEPTPTGTRFVQREEFTGILVPLFARSLDKGTRAGFEAMNVALKNRAEAEVRERG